LFKLVIGSLLIIISLALFILMFYFKEELRMCGIFLRQASIFRSDEEELAMADTGVYGYWDGIDSGVCGAVAGLLVGCQYGV
jgi:hypothetical protein